MSTVFSDVTCKGNDCHCSHKLLHQRPLAYLDFDVPCDI